MTRERKELIQIISDELNKRQKYLKTRDSIKRKGLESENIFIRNRARTRLKELKEKIDFNDRCMLELQNIKILLSK